MKRLVAVVVLVIAVVVGVLRERIYVRDPLGTVVRDGVKVRGAEVYINFGNDVLVEASGEIGAPRYLVQGWNKVPEVPGMLTCLRWMVCVTEAERAMGTPVAARRGYDPQVTMTSRAVGFVDGDGAKVRVGLW
jgi:hypothetical protein